MTAIAFRRANLDDPNERRFLIDAWVGSYRDSYSAGIIHASDWYAVMIPTVERILNLPDVVTIVAYLPGAPAGADLIGFAVADVKRDPKLVYYVFVKLHYRRGARIGIVPGVARQLLDSIGVDAEQPFNYVCETLAVIKLRAMNKIPFAKWKPTLGRFPKEERSR
jgi:hypothetical protein